MLPRGRPLLVQWMQQNHRQSGTVEQKTRLGGLLAPPGWLLAVR